MIADGKPNDIGVDGGIRPLPAAIIIEELLLDMMLLNLRLLAADDLAGVEKLGRLGARNPELLLPLLENMLDSLRCFIALDGNFRLDELPMDRRRDGVPGTGKDDELGAGLLTKMPVLLVVMDDDDVVVVVVEYFVVLLLVFVLVVVELLFVIWCLFFFGRNVNWSCNGKKFCVWSGNIYSEWKPKYNHQTPEIKS